MITSELRFLDVVSGNWMARGCESALAFFIVFDILLAVNGEDSYGG